MELIELHDAQQKGCNVCTFKKKLFFIVGAFFFFWNKNVVFCKGFPLSKYDSSIKGESFLKKSLLTIYDCTFLRHPNDNLTHRIMRCNDSAVCFAKFEGN